MRVHRLMARELKTDEIQEVSGGACTYQTVLTGVFPTLLPEGGYIADPVYEQQCVDQIITA
jgi:hypothetical protein